MRIAFLGYQLWGTIVLRRMFDDGHDVAVVFTHPENSSHPYEQIFCDSVAALAQQRGVPVFIERTVNTPAARQILVQSRCEILVSSNWRRWINPEVLGVPRMGGLNIHDSLLPKYGGFAPINWAMANGESELGVTAHVMSEELDLGDIVAQKRIDVAATETATSAFVRIQPLLAAVASEALFELANGTATPWPQDRSKATFYHKRTMIDGRIDWTRDSAHVCNLVRAQSDPYPNAYAMYQGKKLRIKEVSLADAKWRGTPGRVCGRVDCGVVALCGSGSSRQGVVLHQVQPEDGPAVPAHDYFLRLGGQFDC